jgi:RimJ/RimL family protein N-acetyltransferase
VPDPEHEGVRLRRFRDEDVAMVLDLATDPYVASISTLPAGADDAEARAWIERQHARWRDGVGFSFAIADAADRAVGQIGLWLDRWDEGVGTVGYLIAPRDRGKGAAQRAVRAATTFAAAVPRIDRLEAFIEPANSASVRTAEGAGFECEGRVTHPRRPGGEPVEMIRFARGLSQIS